MVGFNSPVLWVEAAPKEVALDGGDMAAGSTRCPPQPVAALSDPQMVNPFFLDIICLPQQASFTYPLESMGWVYLPTFYHKNQPNVGKYTIHGWYGIGILPLFIYSPRSAFSFLEKILYDSARQNNDINDILRRKKAH